MKSEKQKEKKNTRKCVINIRISNAEKKRIEKKARKKNISVSEYIRQLTLEAKTKSSRYEGDVNLAYVKGMVADIINQIYEKYPDCEEEPILKERIGELWSIFL